MRSPTAHAQSRPHTAAADTRGILCPECRSPLPIRAREPGEVAAHWECLTCHSQVAGVLLKDEATHAAESIQLSHLHFDTKGVPRLSNSLRQLVQEFVACRPKCADVEDRRTLPRAPMLLELSVVPVDENWSPCAKPILGMMINVGASGLGMVTGTRLDAEHAAVQFQSPSGIVQLLGQVIWSRDFGPGFHHSGVHFLLRFGRGAIADPKAISAGAPLN